MSNNRNTKEEPATSAQGKIGKLAARIQRQWNWLTMEFLRRGRNTAILWNFYRTLHGNSRTSSSSTSRSRI